MKKMCIVCHVNPAEIPDRNRMGSPLKRICKKCHVERLKQDFENIVVLENRKRNRIGGKDDL